MRVLVADDDEPVRTMMARVLAQGGCDVVAVSDGVEAVAVESGDERPFDVVVLDIAMPGKNGVEAYREIARRNSASRFLFTSAYYESGLLNDVMREGRSGFLPKPFVPGCILDEIKNLIEEDVEPSPQPAPETLPILFN
jgi:CheY-like chemotaxis protein